MQTLGIRIQGQFYPKSLFFKGSNNPLPASLAQKDAIFEFLLIWFSAEPWVELQTSGSTGKPKKIKAEKKFLTASAKSTITALNLKPNNTAILALPVKFIAGKMMLIRAIEGNLNLFSVEPNAEPDIFDANFTALTPMQVSAILNSKLNKFTGKLIIGGGQLSQSLAKDLSEKNHFEAFETFGMTETYSHIALKKINANYLNEPFRAISGVEFTTNNENMLIIEAPHLGIKQLKTNDIITLIDNKTFIWKGRADFVVNSGGVKIQPEEAERELAKFINFPFFLAGLPNQILGQELVLFIQGDKTKIDTDKILLQVNESKVLPVKLKKIVVIINFVFTPTQKINRIQTINSYEL
jgi:O-succinylbenzoic acid--CoA ligase